MQRLRVADQSAERREFQRMDELKEDVLVARSVALCLSLIQSYLTRRVIARRSSSFSLP
jgi:hypothetical protein